MQEVNKKNEQDEFPVTCPLSNERNFAKKALLFANKNKKWVLQWDIRCKELWQPDFVLELLQCSMIEKKNIEAKCKDFTAAIHGLLGLSEW